MTQSIEIVRIELALATFGSRFMPSQDDQTSSRTHKFRYSRWAARRTAALTMVVLYSFLLWLILGQDGQPGNWLQLLLIIGTAAVAFVFLVISRHPVTRLCVGPEGIFIPYGILRQIGWHEIEIADYTVKRPMFFGPREWLELSLKPDAAPLLRVPFPMIIEKWLIGRTIRIPLHVLRSPSGEVLSSVERFMPVVETDLQTDQATIPVKDAL